MEQSQQNTPHTKSQSQWLAISALTGLLIAMLACLLMVYGSSDQGKTENEAPANPDINRYEIIQLNPMTKIQQLRLDLSQWNYGQEIQIRGVLTFCDWGVQNYTVHLVKSASEFSGLKINIYHVGRSMMEQYGIDDWFGYVKISHDIGTETVEQTQFPLTINPETSTGEWVESEQLSSIKEQLQGGIREMMEKAQNQPVKILTADFRLGIRREATHFALNINGFPLPRANFHAFDTDFDWLAFISSDASDSLQPYCDNWQITDAKVKDNPTTSAPAKYVVLNEKEFKKTNVSRRKLNWEIQVHGRIKRKRESLKTFSLKSDTGIDLVIFSFDGDTNTADIRLNNQMEQVELATHNEEDYYESYAVNPFSRRSDFVVGIRRDPECIQVSVSVANRLVTWRLDKVPNLAVAQLVVSGELAVTKTTYVLPQQYAIQTHLEKGVYVKRTGQRIFKDDCYIPRKIQLQGTAPSITVNRQLVATPSSISFDIEVAEFSEENNQDLPRQLSLKLNMDQLQSAVVQINDKMAQRLANVLRPGYDYSIGIIPRAAHFEVEASVFDKHDSFRVKYQEMDSLVDAYRASGALIVSNLNVIGLPDFRIANSKKLSKFLDRSVSIPEDLKNKDWEISIEGQVKPLGSALSIKQDIWLYDEQKQPIFHFSSDVWSGASTVGIATTVLGIMPGVSPVRGWRDDDYYSKYGNSPFKENDPFLLGILRMGKTVQISVTVGCRLATWEVTLESDPAQFSLAGGFISSSLKGFIAAVDVLKL